MRRREDHEHDVHDIRQSGDDPSCWPASFKRNEFPAPHRYQPGYGYTALSVSQSGTGGYAAGSDAGDAHGTPPTGNNNTSTSPESSNSMPAQYMMSGSEFGSCGFPWGESPSVYLELRGIRAWGYGCVDNAIVESNLTKLDVTLVSEVIN